MKNEKKFANNRFAYLPRTAKYHYSQSSHLCAASYSVCLPLRSLWRHQRLWSGCHPTKCSCCSASRLLRAESWGMSRFLTQLCWVVWLWAPYFLPDGSWEANSRSLGCLQCQDSRKSLLFLSWRAFDSAEKCLWAIRCLLGVSAWQVTPWDRW